MLPVLKKPFETDVIVKILQQIKLGMPPTVASRLDLQKALNNNWIEFWYQPKIDLLRKCVVGAESFARLFHPQKGLLPPSAFLDGASDQSLLALNEIALISALKAGHDFAKLGLNLELHIRDISRGGLCGGNIGLHLLAHPSPLMQLTPFAACGVLGTRARKTPAAPCHPRRRR